MGTGTDYGTEENISIRLEKTRKELQALEDELKETTVVIDTRVLVEFRRAIDNMRQTAWAVHQWIELQTQQRDAAALFSTLTLARIRRATQLSRELAKDFEGLQALLDSTAVKDLHGALELLYLPLHKRLEAVE